MPIEKFSISCCHFDLNFELINLSFIPLSSYAIQKIIPQDYIVWISYLQKDILKKGCLYIVSEFKAEKSEIFSQGINASCMKNDNKFQRRPAIATFLISSR